MSPVKQVIRQNGSFPVTALRSRPLRQALSYDRRTTSHGVQDRVPQTISIP
jgi:hypothetical protein